MKAITKNRFFLTLDNSNTIYPEIEFVEVEPLERFIFYGLTFFVCEFDGYYRLTEKSTGTLIESSIFRGFLKGDALRILKRKGKKETLKAIAKRKFQIYKTTQKEYA